MPEIVKLYQSRRNWLPDPVVQCCSEDGKYHPYCKLKRRRTDNLPAATPVNFSGFRCILLNRPAASDVPRKSHRHLPGCAETAHGRVSVPMFFYAWGSTTNPFASASYPPSVSRDRRSFWIKQDATLVGPPRRSRPRLSREPGDP